MSDPQWPAWVTSEDADIVWIRQGATAADALGEVHEVICWDDGIGLVFEGSVTMVRPVDAGGYAPLLYETDDEHDPQEAVRYDRFYVDEVSP